MDNKNNHFLVTLKIYKVGISEYIMINNLNLKKEV